MWGSYQAQEADRRNWVQDCKEEPLASCEGWGESGELPCHIFLGLVLSCARDTLELSSTTTDQPHVFLLRSLRPWGDLMVGTAGPSVFP